MGLNDSGDVDAPSRRHTLLRVPSQLRSIRSTSGCIIFSQHFFFDVGGASPNAGTFFFDWVSDQAVDAAARR
jgi:hypothetical protein